MIKPIVKFAYIIYKSINKHQRLITLLSKGKTKQAIKLLQNNKHLAYKIDSQGWNLYDTAVAFKNIEFVKCLKSFIECKHTDAYIRFLRNKIAINPMHRGHTTLMCQFDKEDPNGVWKQIEDAENNRSLGINV